MQLWLAYREMSLEDFQRMRSSPYCSAEWVIHELCQFEAEYRVKIKNLLTDAQAALNPKMTD